MELGGKPKRESELATVSSEHDDGDSRIEMKRSSSLDIEREREIRRRGRRETVIIYW